MATKKSPAVKKDTEKVDPKEALAEIAGQIMCGKTDILAVSADFFVLTVVDGKVERVPMGSLQAPPRINKSGSRGVYLNGKLNDPTPTGIANGVVYQIGTNVTACHSKEW